MQIVKTIAEVRIVVEKWRAMGESVGLVTTMGYLHAGHQSLIKRSVEENGYTCVTIFVNPTQFGPGEDLEAYPRDLERDAKLCEETGADLVFAPDPAEMYPQGFCSYVGVNDLPNHLCGLSRPVHFGGVCTVVNKFINIVGPDRAYFGQKDAQQLAIIKRMVADLNMPVHIVGCPIVREPDGLAMSSRNTYLDADERKAALVLSRAIFAGAKLVDEGERDAAQVTGQMRQILEAEPMADVEYVEVVDNLTMESVERLHGDILCAIAVRINGKVRLIDNFIREGLE